MINSNSIANTAGILSLLSSIAMFSPTLIDLFRVNFNRQRLAANISRFSLLLTISFGLAHGLLTTQNVNIDFYSIDTYWIYAGGVFVFNLFVFFAFTFSELKRDSTKLNYISYAALLLLICHVGQTIVF